MQFLRQRSLQLMLYSGLAFAFVLSIASSLQADQTLNITLPPSRAAQERNTAEARQRQSPIVGRNGDLPRARAFVQSRGGLPSRGGGGREERVVGTLGYLDKSAPIYRERSANSRLLINCPSGTYLAVQDSVGAWAGVLMSDGSIGWIRRSQMRALEYQVVSNQTAPPAFNTGSATLPTGTDPGDNFPRSEQPYFNGDADPLLQEAYKYLGVRYVWGGNTTSGLDCSGFIKNVFGAFGMNLPRLGSDQMAYGVPVPYEQLMPGDRLYFGRRTERLGVKHTGLYMGNGYFIHASSGQKQVTISRLDDKTYQRMYVCARR